MKRIAQLLLLSALFMCLPLAAHAAPCGGSVTCFAAVLNMSNANASTTAPVVAYTAPAGGKGVKISAIISNTTGVGSMSGATFIFYIIHSGTNYAFFKNSVSLGTMNVLAQAGPGSVIPTWPTDENGNGFIFLAAGDSLAIANFYGIPPSGETSGTYTFSIIGQSY